MRGWNSLGLYALWAAQAWKLKRRPRPEGSEALGRSLLRARGLPAKAAQILATGNDAQKAEPFRRALRTLQPENGSALLERLKRQRPSLAETIEFFDPKGLSASMAQVHRAILRDGRQVAMKLPLPQASERVRADASAFEMLGIAFPELKNGFDLKAYARYITRHLEGELDFRREAKMQRIFREYAKKFPGIRIPEPWVEAAGPWALPMEWLPSIPLEAWMETAAPDSRQRAARTLGHFLLESFFETGWLHGDPNPGNFGIATERKGGRDAPGKEERVVVYDFGAALRFPDRERKALLAIMNELAAEKPPSARWLADLGLDADAAAALGQGLTEYLSIQFEPFLSERPFDLSTWNRKARSEQALGKDRFRFMAGFAPHWLLFLRTIHGIFRLHLEHGIPFEFRSRLETLWDSASPTDNGSMSYSTPIPNALANSLRVEVFRGEEKTVGLRLPVNALNRLEEFLEEGMTERLLNKGIDVTAIAKMAQRSGYPVGELFRWEEPGKCVKIGLE